MYPFHDDTFDLLGVVAGDGCLYAAMTDDDLMTNAVNFVQSMTCS
jgi:hypothetical protein